MGPQKFVIYYLLIVCLQQAMVYIPTLFYGDNS